VLLSYRSIVDHGTIDSINILQAALRAMRESVQGLPVAADYVLVDGNKVPPGLPPTCRVQTVVKGDATCYAIAAASIIAKVS
jgi:ribonuclease HII